MKFSNNEPKINDALKNFIEKYIHLIEQKEFADLYKRAYSLNTQFETGMLTQILYQIGEDPLPYLNYIPEGFLEGCDALIEVEIPAHITDVGESAFYACDNILSITIPKNVTELAAWSLGGCDELREIVIQGDLKRVDELAFHQDPKLEVVYCTQKTAELIQNTFASFWNGKVKFRIEVIK